MTDKNHPSDIALLLPWYAAGTLSPEETRSVEAYLEGSPEARAELDMIRAEAKATDIAASAVPAMNPGAFDRLLNDIEWDERTQAAQTTAQESFWARLRDSLGAYSAPVVKVGAIAAVLVILIQAAALVSLGDWFASGEYRTAGGDEEVQPRGGSLLVALQPDATAGDVTALLNDLGLVIVDGPTPDGLYVLAVEQSQEQDVVNAAVAALRDRADIIRFASALGE